MSTPKADNPGVTTAQAAPGALDPALAALIDDLLDGALEGRERRQALQRIEADPAAHREYQSLVCMVTTLRAPVESPDFAASVSRDVMFRAASQSVFVPTRRSNWSLPLGIAAVAAIAISVGIFMFGEDGPFDQGSLSTPIAAQPDGDPAIQASPSAQPAPVVADASPTRKVQGHDTSLTPGSTDHHRITGNWGTELPSQVPGTWKDSSPAVTSTTIASGDAFVDTEIAPGRVVSVRVGPSWSLWWIPRDASASETETWRLLTRLANPSVNASIRKNELPAIPSEK
ncbi:MAG TPA: hypothetical protein VK176_12770 [Phycisphaerales bacterium]|nr:hypothetical protein [Phycisphaerales bacterium]